MVYLAVDEDEPVGIKEDKMSRAYDLWYHSTGEQIQEEMEVFFSSIPNSIDLKEDLGIVNVDEFINEKLMFEYESFISDIADMKYQEYKERDI